MLDEPHRQLHALARRAVELWTAGQKQAAEDTVRQVVQTSQRILALLSDLQKSLAGRR